MAFQFNEESRKQLEFLLPRYPTRQSVLLPALRLVENQQGHIDQAGMEYVAKLLDLAPAFVFGVYTFYSHYKREHEGKYVVQVCHTLPCALRGACNVLATFSEALKLRAGETDHDKRFTLKKVECLGSCSSAPVVQINHDYFENLDNRKIGEIIAVLREDKTPPHISNGPTLEQGVRDYMPMVEACANKAR